MSQTACRIAFVGAGYMAREHLRAFAATPGTELVGIHSRTRDRAAALAAEFGIGGVYESVTDLYAHSRADLVVIGVPELAVRAVCEEAFSHPWVCLVEKPAGYDVGDAEAIVAAARHHDRRAFVALNRRHYSSTRSVVSDLANTGERRLIHVYDQEDPIAARKAGRPEQVVRNWMYANSIHLIDYFTVLGRGEIISVEPVVPWTPADPSFVVAKIEFSSGDIGIYEAVWNGPGPWAVTVTTHAKRWELRPLEHASIQVSGSRKQETVALHEWDGEFKPGLRAQAEEAVRAARGLDHVLPSVEEALMSMRLVQRIYGE